MLAINVSCDNHSELFLQDYVLLGCDAAILVFPYKANGGTPASSGDNFIDHRMQAPLSSHEANALWDMIKYRAKRLQQEIWVTTQTFLATMGVEEMDDLSRCDFVRAVEYLVRLDLPFNLSAEMQGAN